MNLTIYKQSEVFDLLKTEWNSLLERSITNRIFSTWEWQSIWWQSYQPGDLWVITCRDDQGLLLAIAPWFIEHNPVRGRVIRTIGCVEVTDYLDIIIDTNHVTSALTALVICLTENKIHYDILDLCNIPETSPTLQQFATILQQQGFAIEITQQEVCPVIELPTDWELYLESLGKKQRHEVRRKIRRAEGAPENVDWYIVDEQHNLKEEIQRFLELMAASTPDKARFLEDQQNVIFFNQFVPVTWEKGWLQLSFLTVGGQAAATYLNFDYDNHIMVYNSGLLPDEYGQLSPGIVLLAHNIKHAIETGHTKFDFLRGNETYKYRMGGVDTGVFMLKAHPTQMR